MHKSPANDHVMTTREAAELLGVSVRTIQLWVESGELSAWKTLGGHRRIARDSVERLAAQRRDAVGTPPREVMRVLVVEDEPDLLHLYGLVIESWELPVEVTTARDGFEGLVRLGESRPDLLITDLMMPGMDGFRMLQSLQQLRPPLPAQDIVAVTALGPAELASRGGLPSGVRVLTKPIPFAALEDIVRNRLNQLRAAGIVR